MNRLDNGLLKIYFSKPLLISVLVLLLHPPIHRGLPGQTKFREGFKLFYFSAVAANVNL